MVSYETPVRNHEALYETLKVPYFPTKPLFCCTKLKKVSKKKGCSPGYTRRSFYSFVFFFVLELWTHLHAFRHLRNLFWGSVDFLFFRVYSWNFFGSPMFLPRCFYIISKGLSNKIKTSLNPKELAVFDAKLDQIMSTNIHYMDYVRTL